MKAVIRYFIERSFVVNLISGFIVIAGILAVTSMKRDLHPPFEFNMVYVNISLYGAAPAEIEKHITYPVEEALANIAGLDHITSSSFNGAASITVNFKASFDEMDDAAEAVRSRIDGIRSQLPRNIQAINVSRNKTEQLFLYWIGLTGFEENSPQHRSYLKKVEQRFSRVTGVAAVRSYVHDRDIYVTFNLEKLKELEISAAEAKSVIQSAFGIAPIGTLDQEGSKLTVEMVSPVGSVDVIKQLPLTSNRTGQGVTIGEVAEVQYKLERVKGAKFVNGQKAISMQLNKDLVSDSIDLKKVIDEQIVSLNKIAPKGVNIVPLVDGPQFIKKQIEVLQKNGIVGFLLVIIILMAFLNWKTALMTSLGLPVAYLGTLIVLYMIGIDIDLLSIVGMILVIGILVDDAIIVSERYIERLEEGHAPKKAAELAVRDLIVPVTGTILTTIVAFSPLLLIKSQMSSILIAIPTIVILALVLSWIESFFILPNHLSHFVKEPPVKKQDGLFLKVKSGYEGLLKIAIKFRYVFGGVIVASFVGVAMLAQSNLKQNFDLNINNEQITVFMTLKESPSIEYSRKATKRIEDFLHKYPKSEVTATFTSVGNIWMSGRMQEDKRFIKIRAMLNSDHSYPTSLKKRLKKEITDYVASIKDERIEKLDVEIERSNQTKEKLEMVTVNVTGEGGADYMQVEKEISAIAVTSEQIKAFVPNEELYQKSWQFKPDSSALIRYQLSPNNISSQIRGLFMSDEINEIRIGEERVNIYAEYKRPTKMSHTELGDFEILTPKGGSVPLKFLGSWQEVNSLQSYDHYKGRRNLNLDFKLDEKKSNAEKAIADLRELLKPVQVKYPGYDIEVIDANLQAQASKDWAWKVAMVCIVGVLMVIALIMGSLTQPFLVGLPIPFALMGIILALLTHNEAMGLMALIGLVGTVGVSVNASIVMVDQMNKMARSKNGGVLSKDIIISAASSRLRAIILTTLTTLGGVFPMAYALGGESGFTQPLAFSLAWGLTFATIMTLLFLPACMEIRNDILKLTDKVINKLFKKKIIESKIDIDEDFIEEKSADFTAESVL